MRYLLIPGVIGLMILALLSESSETPEQYDRGESASSQSRDDNRSAGGQGGIDRDPGSSGEPGSSREYDEERPGDRVVYSEDGNGRAFEDLRPEVVSIETNEGRIVLAQPNGDWPEGGYTWDILPTRPPSLVGFRIVGDHFEPLKEPASLDTEYEISWNDNGELVLANSEETWVLRRDGTDLTVVTGIEGSENHLRSSNGIDPMPLDDNLDVKSEDVGPIFGTRSSDQPSYFSLEPTTWALIGLGVALSMLATGAFLVFKDGIGLVVLDTPERELNLTKKAAAPMVVHVEQLELFTELRKDPDSARVIRYLFELIGSGEWGLPAIRETETPNEFYLRARRTLNPEQSKLLSRLADRYSIVRFAPEMTTSADRDAAIDDAQAFYWSLHRVVAGTMADD